MGGGASTYKLDASVVNANAFAYQSGQEINSQTLKTIPNGNGDITSTLKMLPNVQFDSNQMNSNTPGEIDPANVSISGGLYYQNSFLLDGKSMNNDLSGVNVAARQSGVPDPGNFRTDRIGRSQGLNIDTFLLKSIKVQDSNVGASYGHFTGGVIEAETKRAEKDFGVNFAYQISQGNANDGAFSLTRYHVYGDKQNFLNSSNAENQPKFVKHSFRSSLESKINDKFGVIASFTTTQSFIPLRVANDKDLTTDFSYETRTQKRQAYNFFIKGSYQASDDVLVDTSYTYAPQFGIYYQDKAKNSKTTMKNGGHQLGADLTINNSLGFASINTSFSYLEESRRSDSATNINWLYSPSKNWGQPEGESPEGSFGDEDNKQSDLSLKLAQNFEPYYNDSFENGFNIGAEFSYTYAYFKRLKDSYDATNFQALANYEDIYGAGSGMYNNYNANCVDQFCDKTPLGYDPMGDNLDTSGQYAYTVQEYKAGKVDLDNTQTSAFLENESKFDLGEKGNISARVGLRLDYDTYMQKAPIAPRFSANYTAPWGKDEFRYNTSFTFGANRYYGRNMFAYKLSQGKDKLETTYIRNNANLSLWNLPDLSTCETITDPTQQMDCFSNHKSHDAYAFDFTKLKIPYSDELMFGVVQEIGLFSISSKYIHRFGRDEIRTVCGRKIGNQCLAYTYDNQDKSDTDVVTLTIGNNAPFMAGAMSNFFNFAFDYTNTKRSYNDYSYNDRKSDPTAEEWVSYNGKMYRRSDLPVTNFAQPLSFRFSTTHAINLLRTDWTLNNFFRVRMPYNTTVWERDAAGNTIGRGTWANPYRYKDERIPTRFTWDLRLGIEKAVYGKNIFYTNIDVYNVLDKVNSTVQNSNNKSAILTYELGRQFWLEIGYRY
ncbi:TonB-dependent receptor [Campylobacter sp. MIT 99-7217]|uniref:TonB-dependent receptor plug domain-containing protein n=1 Tax=Campylobacter sp. MIT 99-7217 TaxID=535091 RepID=UPI001157F107|nr:TonB-dependent receptor plug domain-containing protein [Campylobacter sp. MIT 99-7217]TQR34498.1 TonB-dependent receptor [Campylobacter sp. MIT 99-7217]